MLKKPHKKINWISCIAKSILYSFLIMVALGYLFGFKAILVNGGSAEPYIHYKSLIVTTKCKEEDLKVGDFVTFTKTGNSYVTHQIVSISEDGTIICRGWNYDRNLGEYTYQDDIQTITYQNVVGKVIWTNYIIGNTIFVIRGNLVILFGVLGIIVLSFIVRDSIKTKSEFAEF